jgi:hypothetical protein
MKKRQLRLERLRAVEREYLTALLAVEFLREGIRTQTEILEERGLRPRDADTFSDNLEPTYLIRLFAEFEAALRDVWANGFRRSSEPPMRVLIDSVAARRGIPEADRDDVHGVRTYRNNLVHEGGEDTVPVSFKESLSALGRFLSWFPLDW